MRGATFDAREEALLRTLGSAAVAREAAPIPAPEGTIARGRQSVGMLGGLGRHSKTRCFDRGEGLGL